MKYYRELIIAALIVLFGLYWFHVEHGRSLESTTTEITRLEAQNTALERELSVALDSVKHFKILSDTWFALSLEKRAAKTVIIHHFNDEKAKIDSLPSDSLQMIFNKRYLPTSGH